jgi:GntR family transcriptional regulator
MNFYFNYKLDKSNSMPLYFQLKRIFMQMIEKDEISPRDIIPKESELCQIFDVSRTTVRQALNELVNEGVFYRVKGHGTFVAMNKIRITFSSHSPRLAGTIKNKQLHLSYHPIASHLVKSPPPITQALKRSKKDTLLCRKEVLYVDKEPIAISYTYSENLPSPFSNNLNPPLAYIKREFSVGTANPEDISLLTISRSTAIQIISNTGYHSLNQPVIYNLLRFRGDMTIFEFE